MLEDLLTDVERARVARFDHVHPLLPILLHPPPVPHLAIGPNIAIHLLLELGEDELPGCGVGLLSGVLTDVIALGVIFE